MWSLILLNLLAIKLGEPAVLSAGAPATWYQVTALPGDYDDVSEIRYRELEVTPWRGRTTVDASSWLSAAGTHHLKAVTNAGSQTFTVVIRNRDGYVGYLSELLGVPFVMYPNRPGAGQPTDQRIAADCVATVIYGWRRTGCQVPYVAPAALYRYADAVRGSVREGDILHFGFQTAVLARDVPPRGVLSDDDQIIHSYHELVEMRRYADLPYRSSTLDILRWRPCD